MSIKTTRMTITVPIQTWEAIDELAKEMNITGSAATQHLLKIGMTVEAVAIGGGQVLAKFANGDSRVLADSNGNFTYRTPLLT